MASKWAFSATSGHQKWAETIVLSFDYPILTYSPFSGDYTKNFSPFEIDKRYIMQIFTIFTHFWPKNEHFQPLPVTGNEFFFNSKWALRTYCAFAKDRIRKTHPIKILLRIEEEKVCLLPQYHHGKMAPTPCLTKTRGDSGKIVKFQKFLRETPSNRLN